ncbi:hypothetical protein PCANC_03913 [Puccinia coronata f. sp. avenae]|uniref:Mei2-like C-terminal RNA recognition motif domain-containing protein n=1 Tax=Puccinia coronata f. sp. avenae TaxID=200324 RepID=A0A2N5SQS0_9BASI|nr:hypothetical protein PCASD_21776 [Puccinia coronata f. sp. avenae]PLW56018.1 hypothetical protein PCANC_03913 [Puccinia coronata f. sp. avenae]
MDGQAPVSVLRNSPSKATVSDHLGTATPPPLSNASSIHSSPMAESPVALGPVKYAAHLPFKPADNRSDEEPALKQGEPVAACVASPVGVSASDTPNPAFSSIVSGKSANLMSKWLPSSTSALAEPLEQEGASRKKDAPNSNIPMTPPFTPLKRSDQLSGINNSQHAQLRGMEKSRAMLMTPPATIKREQILHKPRSPLSGLTPSYRLSGKASSRGSSPNSQDFHTRPTAVETLAHQMSLLPIENHRPRSASSPMEPSSDHGPNSNLNRLLPPKADTFGLSLGESPAEYRKRAGTLCSIPSAPFGSFVSDINSPASLLLNQRKHQTPSGSLGRSQHVPNYPTSSLNMFAGVSSPLAFSHVTSYLGANHQHTEDPATLLFPASRNPSDFASNSSHSAKQPPLLVGSAAGDRHQRYHTAPTDSNPLFHSGRPPLPLSSTEGTPATSDLVRRIEERSMSLIGSSPVDRIHSNLFNVQFRPRSSTVADTSGGRATGKSLLSVNWEGEESSKNDESEAEAASRTTPGAQIGDSARPSSNRPQPWGTTLGATSPRYCKVLGIPPKLLGSMKGIVRVRNAFAAYGDLLDIHVDTLSPVGFILVGFHDTRSILNLIQNGVKALENTFGSYLKMEPLQRSDVIQLTQDFDNPVLSSNEGALNLRFEDPRGIITEDVLIEYLQRYGDLKALRAVGPSRWFVEWYDDRRADAAQKQLVARDFADFQVTVDVPEQELRSMLENQYSGGMAGSMGNGLAPSVCLLPPTIRPPAMLNSGDQYNNTLLYRYVGEPYASNYVFPWNQTMSIPPPASYYNVHAPTSLPVDGLGGVASHNLTPDLFGSPAHRLDQQVSPHSPAAHRPRAFPFPGVPPSNVMDLDRIECGSDPRTTCMIKNIPNKITDEMLYNFINEVCPRGFDFLYLRMDFKARLNVGYAFINFLSVENVLKFAKSKLGVKWGVFLSEKTVQMCYASIQGKENLIEKFRNSAIMEEEESFRPKIYHSSGPLMGLPEPFPHANDLQRKARSQANAALLVRPPVTSINPVTQ